MNSDNKHKATFHLASNDHWQRGREITLEKYDKAYVKEPLLMDATQIGSEIKDPNQKFIFIYDFNRNWTFLIELISVSKEGEPEAGLSGGHPHGRPGAQPVWYAQPAGRQVCGSGGEI